MGVIYRTYREPDPWRYEKEFNADGTEKHINCDGARYHVLSYYSRIDASGELVGYHKCSEPNCEINRENADA